MTNRKPKPSNKKPRPLHPKKFPTPSSHCPEPAAILFIFSIVSPPPRAKTNKPNTLNQYLPFTARLRIMFQVLAICFVASLLNAKSFVYLVFEDYVNYWYMFLIIIGCLGLEGNVMRNLTLKVIVLTAIISMSLP
jgi:hypothetical protein